jgi:hypothetical protein
MPKITPLLFDSYLAIIKSSVGSKMFRAFFAEVGGKKTEVTQKGNLSCAFFVSFILKYFDLIAHGHMTITGLIRDMEESGWKRIEKPKPGCVLIWEAVHDGGNKFYTSGHRHIGFYIGKDKAVSNLSSRGWPAVTPWTFGMKNGKAARRVEAMYWNTKLK